MAKTYFPLAKGFIITSPFGDRAGGFHYGTDFGKSGGSAGLPVYAVRGGTVLYAGPADGYGGPDPAGWIVIDHPTEDGGGVSEYGHIVREVKVGQRVEAGQRIGYINPNSKTNGGVAPHLHLSVMPYDYNPSKKIDPIKWLGAASYVGETAPAPKPVTPTTPVVQPPKENKMIEIDQTGVSPNSSQRWGAKVRLFVLHTQEGDGTAQSLANYLQNANSGVSYHYSIDNRTCIDVVDTDRYSWSVLNANPYTINLCFAGSRASFDRATWVGNYGAAIDYAAFLFVQDAKKYGIDARTLTWDEIRAGHSGGTDHRGITEGLRIGDHTDVGPNFPWDLYRAAIDKYARGVAVVAPAPAPNAIDVQYQATPWLAGKLTQAVEESCPDGRGKWAKYENGYIYWTAETGARPIPNNVFETWAELGYEGGVLGYPVAYHTVLKDTNNVPIGDVQAFEHGVLYRKYGQPGFFVTGKIGERWMRSGYENSVYGWPTSNEIAVGDGSRIQHFENGTSITWSPDGTLALKAVGGADTIVPDVAH